MANYLGRREKGVKKFREKGDENLGDMGPYKGQFFSRDSLKSRQKATGYPLIYAFNSGIISAQNE